MMHTSIKASSVLWMAATLLAAVLLPSPSTAEILTTGGGGGVGTSSSSSSSLHKTWSKFIQCQSLISKLEEDTSSSATATMSNSDTTNHHHRRTTTTTATGGLAKLPCFVRRLPPTSLQLQQQSTPLRKTPSMVDIEWSLATGQIITKIRGGAAAAADHDDEYDTTDDESSSDEEEYDSEYEDEYDSEYEDETDNEEEEEQTEQQQDDNIVSSLTSSSLQSSLRSKSSPQQQIQQYDDVLAPPAMQQLVISLGVMFLSQRIDILDAKTVRIARFAFVAYVVVMQVFLLYVRLRARAINDRTEITLSNPLASLVQGAAGGAAGGVGGGNFMVKALADQMLSSTTTIYEYDLAQAKKMNSGLLMPMIFLYFLHFKMKQVQPLLMQTATGVMNMVYSPLFQVYVLGRNLERPFKPSGSSMMDALQTEDGEESSGSSSEQGVDDEDDVVEENDVDEDEEESEESEGESDEGEEESDGDESEYDTDEE